MTCKQVACSVVSTHVDRQVSKLSSLRCRNDADRYIQLLERVGLNQEAGPTVQTLACSLHRLVGVPSRSPRQHCTVCASAGRAVPSSCHRPPLSLPQQPGCLSGVEACLNLQAALRF